MKIVITPNPYRDKQFQCAVQARKILEECGVTVQMCLPFDVDKEYVLPDGSAFADLKTEIRDADILICFGGDGTILHASKIATARQIPVLGVNICTMPTTELTPEQLTDGRIGVIDLMLACGLIASRGEGRRLIQQNGVTADEEKIASIDTFFTAEQLKTGVKLRKGKKIFHKAVLKA